MSRDRAALPEERYGGVDEDVLFEPPAEAAPTVDDVSEPRTWMDYWEELMGPWPANRAIRP